jgi:hypothetical protein
VGANVGSPLTFEERDWIVELVYSESNRIPILALHDAGGKATLAHYNPVVVEPEATK